MSVCTANVTSIVSGLYICIQRIISYDGSSCYWLFESLTIGTRSVSKSKQAVMRALLLVNLCFKIGMVVVLPFTTLSQRVLLLLLKLLSMV